MVNNDTLKEVGDTIVSLKADKKLCFMLLIQVMSMFFGCLFFYYQFSFSSTMLLSL